MNNRLLSLFIIVVFFGGLFSVYYYFFVANVGNVSFVINGSGTTEIELTSEFQNTYRKSCDKLCNFEKIPPVNYRVRATREGYKPLEKTFSLDRGDTKKVVLALEKEILLIEKTREKEETIRMLKLKKDISDSLESTGSTVLGNRPEGLYFALPDSSGGWNIYLKNETESKVLFTTQKGELSKTSLDIYEGYLTLFQEGSYVLYKLSNGTKESIETTKKIVSIKDTPDRNIKILTTEDGVFLYREEEKSMQENPLYDDIIVLPDGQLVALIKKTSEKKLSLLSLSAKGNDYVVRIGADTRERKILFTTEKSGKKLEFKNREIIFTDTEDTAFVVSNIN